MAYPTQVGVFRDLFFFQQFFERLPHAGGGFPCSSCPPLHPQKFTPRG